MARKGGMKSNHLKELKTKIRTTFKTTQGNNRVWSADLRKQLVSAFQSPMSPANNLQLAMARKGAQKQLIIKELIKKNL